MQNYHNRRFMSQNKFSKKKILKKKTSRVNRFLSCPEISLTNLKKLIFFLTFLAQFTLEAEQFYIHSKLFSVI